MKTKTQYKYRIKEVFNKEMGRIVYIAQRKNWFVWHTISSKQQSELCAKMRIDEIDRIKKSKVKHKTKYKNYEPKN